jgi:fructose-bisphosphate aldolase class I
MSVEILEATARALVAPGKGVLAADESHPSIARRFEPLGIPNTEDARRRYRQMLLTTPGAADFVSGVILFDETLRQKADDGTPLVEVLSRQGIIPGSRSTAARRPSRARPGSR